MTTWNDFKKDMSAISPQDMVTIETLSQLTATQFKEELPRKTLRLRLICPNHNLLSWND